MQREMKEKRKRLKMQRAIESKLGEFSFTETKFVITGNYLP